jgi:Sec-independent protein translocase protein TatA
MADIGGFKDALSGLQALMPRVPEALTALSEAQAALSEAAEAFLSTLEARQVEAAELFPRLEVSLAGISREAVDATAQVEQHRELSSDLADPTLSFEEPLLQVVHVFVEKQQAVVQEKAAALTALSANASNLQGARQSLGEGLVDGRQTVVSSVDTSLAATLGLQGVVEAARVTISTDVERLGTEMDGQHTAQVRDMEALRRDVEGAEAAYVERIDRVREVVRQDGDRMVENLRDRLDDLGSTLGRALTNLRDGLRDLDERLREAAEEGGEGRQSLAPQFEDLENMLPHLRQTIQQVREAAAMVGIPF